MELDARVGGKWRWELRTAEGEEMAAFGEYREIRPGEKLVYTWKWGDDPAWEKVDSLVTVVDQSSAAIRLCETACNRDRADCRP